MRLYLSLMEGLWILAAKISRCEGCDVSCRSWGPHHPNSGSHGTFKGMSQLFRGSGSLYTSGVNNLVRAVDLVVVCEV